MMDMM